MWHGLKGSKMLGYKFRRQHGVDRYILDFYCPELRLAIEVDGESHNSKETKVYDAFRQKQIEKHGIRFLRFRGDEVTGDIDRALGRIEKEICALKGL